MGHLWMLQAYAKLAQSFNSGQIKLLDGLHVRLPKNVIPVGCRSLTPSGGIN